MKKIYTMKYSRRKYIVHELYSQIFRNIYIIFIYVGVCSYIERNGTEGGKEAETDTAERW